MRLSIVLVGPGGIGEQPLHRGFHLARALPFAGHRVDAGGDYVWNLWRPYSCCQDRGIFLFNVDWINYPP